MSNGEEENVDIPRDEDADAIDDLLGDEDEEVLDYGEDADADREDEQQAEGHHHKVEGGVEDVRRMGRVTVVPSPREPTQPRPVPAAYYEDQCREEGAAAPSDRPQPPPPPPRSYGREDPTPQGGPRPFYPLPQGGYDPAAMGDRGRGRHPGMHVTPARGRGGRMGFMHPQGHPQGPQVMMVMLPSGELMPVIPMTGVVPMAGRGGGRRGGNYHPPPPPRPIPPPPPPKSGGSHVPIHVVREGGGTDPLLSSRVRVDGDDELGERVGPSGGDDLIGEMPDVFQRPSDLEGGGEEGLCHQEERLEDLEAPEGNPMDPSASHQPELGDGRQQRGNGHGSHVNSHRGGGGGRMISRGGGRFHTSNMRGPPLASGPKKWVRADASGSTLQRLKEVAVEGDVKKLDPAEELKRRLKMIEERKKARAEAAANPPPLVAGGHIAPPVAIEVPTMPPPAETCSEEQASSAAGPAQEDESIVKLGGVNVNPSLTLEPTPNGESISLRPQPTPEATETQLPTSQQAAATISKGVDPPAAPAAASGSSLLSQEMQRLKRLIEQQEVKLKQKKPRTS